VSLLRLTVVVVALSVCVGLALTNPTMDGYLTFLEIEMVKALDRSDQVQVSPERTMVKSIFRSHSHELVEGLVRPHTVRRNWGLASSYESHLFDSHILVLGIGGRYIPLKGVDEAVIRLGRMAF
jgi:hypothetical protein